MENKKVVFLFPGQGSQYVGMGKDLYENFPAVRKLFDRASERLGMDMKALCFDGPEEVLRDTVNVQPAVTLVNAACLEVLKAEGLEPVAAAGHSLGEYTALFSAGVMDFEELIDLVSARGRFMQEAAEKNPGGMLAVMGLGPEAAEQICRETGGEVALANINSPMQIILTGSGAALKTVSKKAKERGAKLVIPLRVSGPWHSRFMAPAAERMARVLGDCSLQDARFGVIANVTADYERRADEIRKNLTMQITSPVLWQASIERFTGDGYNTFVEAGPKKVLRGIVRDIDRKIKVYNVEDTPTLKAFLESLEVNEG